MRGLVAGAVPVLAFGLACGGVSVDPVAHLKPVCEASNVGGNLDLARVSGVSAAVELRMRIDVSADELRVDWQGTDLDGLEQLLSDKSASMTELSERVGNGDWDRVVQVAVAPDVPGPRVAAIAAVMSQAQLTKVEFLVASDETYDFPDYPDPAYAAELKAELAELDPAMRAMHSAQLMEAEISMCPGANQAFEAVAHASAEMRCVLLAAGLAEALPSCIATDGDKVVTIAQVLSEPSSELKPAALRVDSDPGGTPVAMSGAWSDIAAGLASYQGKSVWLE